MGQAKVRKKNGTRQPNYKPTSPVRSPDYCPHGQNNRYECFDCGVPPEQDGRASVSYHEGAHAVMYVVNGIPITGVSAVIQWTPQNLNQSAGWVQGAVELDVDELELDSDNIVGFIKGTVAGDLAQVRMGFKPEPVVDPSDERMLYMSRGDAKQLIGTFEDDVVTAQEKASSLYQSIADAVKEDFDRPEIWN